MKKAEDLIELKWLWTKTKMQRVRNIPTKTNEKKRSSRQILFSILHIFISSEQSSVDQNS